uniref:AN1-type domain-containing protein n=1 Tax=Caenorhabditis tropicalis TaxID=1561998 RepID=A0A1I7T2Q4_9PELO
MAEFPNLGKHCESAVCNRLDFLPIKCSSCSHFYCSEHYTFEAHNCPTGSRVSVQVPICPICEKPVPTPKNGNVDFQVNEHIQNNCQTKKSKVYTNACSVPKCRKKELVAMNCSKCRSNYCLSHRHERDHSCERKQAEYMATQKRNQASWAESLQNKLHRPHQSLLLPGSNRWRRSPGAVPPTGRIQPTSSAEPVKKQQ